MKYGFYSEKAANDGYGTCFWSTPSGSEVEITAVYTDPTASGYGFKDKRCVGEVVKWIRTGLESTILKPYLEGLRYR